jgi:hypothetical protein
MIEQNFAKFLKQMKSDQFMRDPRYLKIFSKKTEEKTFNKLLERIELGITNNGNYPQHLIKLN